MKFHFNFRKIIIELISLLYILLFVYAGFSKVLDFENFQVQLGQSPLLSAFAHWVSWAVIAAEFITALLLAFPRTRTIGLHAGFCLMTMFSAYIFIILNYSSFVPCSCGGILEKMSWEMHLVFNIVFVVLAAAAILFNPGGEVLLKRISNPVLLLISFISGTALVGVLFLTSEKIMHYQNPFIRRYPHHPVALEKTVDLKYNSYYFAGDGKGKLYLGNTTVPLSLLAFDEKMKQQKIRIGLGRESFFFKSIKIAVRPPFFYIFDGGVPVIFKGQTSDWKAALLNPAPPYFNIAVPADSTSIVFRGTSSKTNNNVIGVFGWGKQAGTALAPQLLQKQIDGVFDVDGMLHYSTEMKRMIYLYTYRNEYIVADKNGMLDFRGHTIDTISHAKIKVAYLKGNKERAMAVPILNVNRTSSIWRHFLFVNSNVPGKYEPKESWKNSSVIDVYDLNKKSYVFSFHIDGIKGKKLRNFYVVSDRIFVLIDTKLTVYKFSSELNNKINGAADSN
ncbi:MULTISPECIES: DoxX family protein [Flavobacterium]|uniref:DoxX family protein n=1 Tax=Flavobacterium TaxID=237 RepID=UPI0021139DA1|nr:MULTISPECIES: MauE/DoxX family redox-associated membrane protein [Flavobacterium]UUF13133.1 hypothetical protein NLJ00_17885 [Flavobacterium panici]